MERAASPPETPPGGSHLHGQKAQDERERHFREGIRAGDEAAWRALSAQYHHMLLRNAARLLPRNADAEDVVAQVLYRAVRAASKYDPERSPYPWLAKICLHECLKYRRDRKPLLSLVVPFLGKAVREPDTLDVSEARAAVHKALRRLTKREREVLTLRYIFRLSATEIADVTGLRPKSVRQELTRGLTSLRTGPSGSDLLEHMDRLARERTRP